MTNQINITTAKSYMREYINADIPVFIWGNPGIGKSESVHQLARENDATVIDIRLSLFDPVDLRGLPATIDGKTVWLKPAFWPEHSDRPIYLFFDEMDRAPASVKNAGLQIVLDRMIGEHKLPENVRVFAAGNGASDKGFSASMGTALNNRFAHIEMKADHDAWCEYAATNGWNPALVAFIRMRGNSDGLFINENPGRDEKAFPTPRNWQRVNTIIANDCSKAIRHGVASGIVGESASAEFMAFLDVFESLGDIMAQIESKPDSAPVSDKININYALAEGMAANASQANFGAYMSYAKRLPREYQILFVTSATSRTPELKNTSAYCDFANSNQHVFA